MLFVVKMLLMTFSLFGQARIMPNPESSLESELDTLSLPKDHPEWVLARRAMASEGLCRSGHDTAKDSAALAARAGKLPEASVSDYSIVRLVAEACE